MRKCWDPDPGLSTLNSFGCFINIIFKYLLVEKRPSFETIKLTLNHIWEEWQISKPEKVAKDRKQAAITASIVDFGRTISDDSGQLAYKANIISRGTSYEMEEEEGSEKEKERTKESRQDRRRRKKQGEGRKEDDKEDAKQRGKKAKNPKSEKLKDDKQAAKGKGKRKLPHFF